MEIRLESFEEKIKNKNYIFTKNKWSSIKLPKIVSRMESLSKYIRY